MEMCGKAVKMMSKIECVLDRFDSDSSDETCEILNCQFPFVHFFQLIVFVSENRKYNVFCHTIRLLLEGSIHASRK